MKFPRSIMKRHVLLISIVWSFHFTYGQDLHREIQEIYNFEPHKLSKESQEPKVKLMDAFWEKVTKEKNKYLQELRVELKDKNNPTFFLYDGGHLLISLSNSKDDYQIALDAMTRVNLKNIDPSDYVKTMNFFAQNELNTTEGALKIISDDAFVAYIPQHALSLDKGLSLRFLLPIDNNLYLKQTINKLATLKDLETIKYVLNFLFYTCTCEADSLISKYANDKDQEKGVRKYAGDLVKMNAVTRNANMEKYSALVKKRKEILQRISDEALDELNDVSKKLKEQYRCK